MVPRRVIVAGYYGFDNLGDEALLQAVLRWLARFPELEPWVLSPRPQETRRRHGARALNRWNPLAIGRALRGAGALIFGGGGVLQDRTSRRSLWYYLELIRRAQRWGVPTLLVGQGLGPLSPWGRARVAPLLRRANYLSVRDPLSLRLARSWGVPARLGPDWTFSLALTPRPAPRPEALGLALAARPGTGALPALARALSALRVQAGLEPVFLPAQPRDLSWARRLSRQVPLTVRSPPGGAEAFLAQLGPCRLLWASRLHALILATVAGVPFVALSDDPKVSAFVARLNAEPDLSLPCLPLAGLSASALCEASHAVLERHAALSRALPQAARALRRQARAALEDAAHRLAGLVGLQSP